MGNGRVSLDDPGGCPPPLPPCLPQMEERIVFYTELGDAPRPYRKCSACAQALANRTCRGP